MVHKPGHEKSKRKPKLSPRSKIMTAKTEAGIRKAKRTQKEVTNAPVEFSGVKRMPDRSMADAGAAGTKAIKKILKGPSKRVNTSVTPKTNRKAPKRKSMAEAGSEGTAAFTSIIKRVLGAGRQEGKGSLDSFAKGVERAKVEAKGYDASMGKSAGSPTKKKVAPSVTKAAPKKEGGPKKATASASASYAPKGRSNKHISDATKTEVGRLKTEAERKSLRPTSVAKKTVPSKTATVSGPVMATSEDQYAVPPTPVSATKPKTSYPGRSMKARPSLNAKTGPKGNTGVVGKFEDKIGGFMSKVFGSYSAASGVEGTDSYTVKKYKKGKRV